MNKTTIFLVIDRSIWDGWDFWDHLKKTFGGPVKGCSCRFRLQLMARIVDN